MPDAGADKNVVVDRYLANGRSPVTAFITGRYFYGDRTAVGSAPARRAAGTIEIALRARRFCPKRELMKTNTVIRYGGPHAPVERCGLINNGFHRRRLMKAYKLYNNPHYTNYIVRSRFCRVSG
ncbi:hypothetical protein EVAR_57289_1 [Eumeta japonica]|uniref:Uncharacterized protein n=1 Tax=Eumeta variegata TaxID=151549 RepID=A0A4C1YPF0_EUMVA|nr:hypothetical protein EVAR_57289_1 [Eumeta japonica]